MKLKKKIKLICTDIDGTLLDINRDISPETAKTFKSLEGQIPIILASSRMPSAMYYIQEKLGILGSPLIAYNGALVLDKNGKTLYSATLSFNLLRAIINHNNHKNYNISTFCTDIWRTEKMDEWTLREINNTRVKPEITPLNHLIKVLQEKDQKPHKIMCMGEAEELDDLLSFLDQNKLQQEAHFYRSKKTYLEISAKNIDKSKALKLLLDEVYRIEMINVIAFGDNHNDIELLKNAGQGVAVTNATQSAKKVAHYVSPFTNKEDAVAKALQHFKKNN